MRTIDRYGNEVRGLSDTQLRVLKVLRDHGATGLEDALSLPQIALRCGIGDIVCRRAVGRIDPSTRARYENVVGYPSLLSRGDIRVVDIDSVGVYFLTPSGAVTVDAVTDALAVLCPPRSGGEQ